MLAVLFLLMAFGAQAQMKIAHINQQVLLEAMPQAKEIEDSLNTIAGDLENELKLMLADIQEEENEIIENPSMLPAVRKSKEDFIIQMRLNAQKFQMDAQEDLSALQDTLLAPLIARIKKAIDEVCAELGYNYVFDTSLGNPIFTDPKHDILAAVKKKLNI